MRIVFIGPPGSGKGTQAQRLAGHLGIAHLSTGDLLRDAEAAGTELGRRAAQFMNAGRLVPDDVVVGIVADRLADCAAGCLFDGFPRTLHQAQALDQLLDQRCMPLDLVLSLEVPEAELKERLLARGRADDNVAAIDQRFRQHHRLTEPLLEYYRARGILHSIDGTGTPDEVFARIRAAVTGSRIGE